MPDPFGAKCVQPKTAEIQFHRSMSAGHYQQAPFPQVLKSHFEPEKPFLLFARAALRALTPFTVGRDQTG
jgi:hypothetical protein